MLTQHVSRCYEFFERIFRDNLLFLNMAIWDSRLRKFLVFARNFSDIWYVSWIIASESVKHCLE